MNPFTNYYFSEFIAEEVCRFLDTLDDYSTEELESLLKGWKEYVKEQMRYERIEYTGNCFLYLSYLVKDFLEIFREHKNHINDLSDDELNDDDPLDRATVNIIYSLGVKTIEFIYERKKGEYSLKKLEVLISQTKPFSKKNKEYKTNCPMNFSEFTAVEASDFLDTFDYYPTEKLETLIRSWKSYVEDQLRNKRLDFLYLSGIIEDFVKIFYEYKNSTSDLSRDGSLDRAAVSIIYGFGAKAIKLLHQKKQGLFCYLYDHTSIFYKLDNGAPLEALTHNATINELEEYIKDFGYVEEVDCF